HLGAERQYRGHREALANALVEQERVGLALAEADGGERLFHPRFDRGRRESQVSRAEGDLLLDAGGEELMVGILEDVADPPGEVLEGLAGYRGPVHEDLPRRRREETVQVLGERRLAGAVPADEGDELATDDPEVHVGQ